MREYTEAEMIDAQEDVFIQKNFIPAGTAEEAHTHAFVELVYIASGKSTHYINDNAYELHKGNLLFINFNQVHRYVAQTDVTYVNLLMNPEFMSEKLMNSKNIYEIFFLLLPRDAEAFDEIRPSIAFSGKDMMRMERIIENCIEEFRDKKTGYLNILHGYMQIIFTMILRNMRSTPGDVNRIRPALDDIIKYIDTHYHKKLTMEMLAEQCFYNTSYLSRMFKECYGKTCTAYIREKRLDEAVKLLEQTELPVEEIVARVGYHDKSLFYKHLKEFTGTTPSALRGKRDTTD